MNFIRRCWFLKCSEEIHYVPIGASDMWYYVPVDDGWEEVLGCNVYITSQYWDVMYTPTLHPSTSPQMPNIELHRQGIEPGPPLIECGRSTIELWNLYIIWVCKSYITSQYFSPNAKYWPATSGNRTRPHRSNVDALPLSYGICT